MDNLYRSRVGQLRHIMSIKGWDAVIITGSDPHCSEYPASRWKQVEWISGFTGEAGDIVVTADHAGLWTDTRYFIQAREQLDGTGIELHKTRVPEQVLIPEWLAGHFRDKDNIVIAVDGLCQQACAIDTIADAMTAAGRSNSTEMEYTFRFVDVPDMLDMLWSDRPAIPVTPVSIVPEQTAGESRTDRIAMLRREAMERGCDSILISALDEIAWTLNVRGSDIEYNPMVISYLLITADSVKWFVRKNQFADDDPETLDSFIALESDDIEILPYDEAQLTLSNCLCDGSARCLYVDPSSLNWSLYKLVRESGTIHEGPSLVQLPKAVKNQAEIAGMKRAHLQDGIAMEKFLYWLEKTVNADKIITEWQAATKLGALRAANPDYIGDSFETISAVGKGAALPHYITPRTNAPEIEAHGLYLCDSGGQYSCGTTDITRTVPLGPCTALEQEDYTLVLKGHIDLAKAIFPEGTAGCQLDVLARNPLWQCKRNFGHGTGHGVGFYLGVHEGPQDIRQNFNKQPILPGMITSDEPGIYREGMHGVRHENLILCVEAGRNDFGSWLKFEPLTLCHFDTSILRTELLSDDEIAWLNDYNASVFRTLSPMLPADVKDWLREKTAPISRN